VRGLGHFLQLHHLRPPRCNVILALYAHQCCLQPHDFNT
jgi:hypothetical protein